VITTARTWAQVEKLIGREIHKAAVRSRYVPPALHKTEL
jgi:hypothetical protein